MLGLEVDKRVLEQVLAVNDRSLFQIIGVLIDEKPPYV
jgi:hypothetical protein